jgi:hypothetical protein
MQESTSEKEVLQRVPPQVGKRFEIFHLPLKKVMQRGRTLWAAITNY